MEIIASQITSREEENTVLDTGTTHDPQRLICTANDALAELRCHVAAQPPHVQCLVSMACTALEVTSSFLCDAGHATDGRIEPEHTHETTGIPEDYQVWAVFIRAPPQFTTWRHNPHLSYNAHIAGDATPRL